MKPDTTDLVARLEGLLAKATPLPWKADGNDVIGPGPFALLLDCNRTVKAGALGHEKANAALIAEAITALPALLAAVREGEAEVERLRAQVHDLLHPRMSGWTEEEKADIRAHYAASQPSQPTEGSNGS